MQERPTSLTVFAIIHFVFAGLGLFGSATQFLWRPYMRLLQEAVPDAAMPEVYQGAGMQAWMYVSGGLGCLASVALIFAGIGLLSQKKYGWTLSVIWAFYSIVMCVAGGILNLTVFQSGLPEGNEAAARVGGLIGGFCGLACGIAYPIVVLAFLLPKSMRDRFGDGDMASHVNPYAPPPAFTGQDVPYQSQPPEENDGGWKSD